ncbi:hypothetical protein [Burkholderia lata]|uniref:hypothetical protein n=1 Tax=Burkholderia lata (strain ATCC 17760 / DSM 23089 / LMG 22485 / NCIMB 9086 / R18194 / 383) TaxID=482957 RepID=UPI00242A56AB|nr:hypothetical protein [Burkholderia lata]
MPFNESPAPAGIFLLVSNAIHTDADKAFRTIAKLRYVASAKMQKAHPDWRSSERSSSVRRILPQVEIKWSKGLPTLQPAGYRSRLPHLTGIVLLEAHQARRSRISRE